MMASVLSELIGRKPSFCAAVQAGGASAGILVMQAAALVGAGICRHVLIATGDNRLTGMGRDQAVAALADVGHQFYERPFGISVLAAYALVAQRHMHDYGTTLEDRQSVVSGKRGFVREDRGGFRIINTPNSYYIII